MLLWLLSGLAGLLVGAAAMAFSIKAGTFGPNGTSSTLDLPRPFWLLAGSAGLAVAVGVPALLLHGVEASRRQRQAEREPRRD